MKKEKTVKTYQRRTKSGKVITVKQHTAKYDAAEALKKASKKGGAGEELDALKKKSSKESFLDDYLGVTPDEFEYWCRNSNSPVSATPNSGVVKKVADSMVAKMGLKNYTKFDNMAAKYQEPNKVYEELVSYAKKRPHQTSHTNIVMEAQREIRAQRKSEEKLKKSIKVIPLPKKSDDSLSRKKGPFYFNVYSDKPVKVERDSKNHSAWNVSFGGETPQTFDSQQKAFAFLRRVKRANGFRKSRQAAYEGATASIPLD